ncbi:MAG: AraC family transcriptional regulator ligand-binding domain-containing protein [Proteobacteria bacterium]|nr:AraC family transcriptional regulator ligand-binding domain-containing protein [Pseudomonadota bacterium]
MPETTVAAGFVRALLELAVSKGANRDVLVARAGVEPTTLGDQDNRVPFSAFVALMREGKRLSGDMALALHFGEAFDVADLSIIGLVGRSSSTLAEAFEQSNRYADLAIATGSGDPAFVLMREGDHLWMVDTRPIHDDFYEHIEGSFARMVCTARRWFPGQAIIKAVHVTWPAPPYRSEYDRVLQVPVVFESINNALLTDGAWLDMKPAHASRYAFDLFRERADSLAERVHSSGGCRSRVEAYLTPMLHRGDVRKSEIADAMGMSSRTLSRRLQKESTSFQALLDQLRRKTALQHLNKRGASVASVAHLVGFSEPAAFSRAFKRWTGRNPRAARWSKRW